jgi:hypothetical protein
MMLSESATAQFSLTSTTGTQGSLVYHYDISVTDTGTTNIGTFWFAWIPGEDFLPHAPQSEGNPTGWGSVPTGGGIYDGSAIQWVASSNAITPGHTLDGFAFTSSDSPTVLAGKSPFYPTTDILTSFVYAEAPEAPGDLGSRFTVAAVPTTAATTTTLASSQPGITVGSSVTITATVAPVTSNGSTPTGTVSFSEDGTALGSIAVQSDGTAQLMTSALPIGSDPITAVYSGDANFATSTSTALSETVTGGSALTTTSLSETISRTTIPASAAAGAKSRALVVVKISNGGNIITPGKTTVSLYASQSGFVDGAASRMNFVIPPLRIRPGKFALVVLPAKQIPAVAAGMYTILVQVIDANGGTSTVTSGVLNITSA